MSLIYFVLFGFVIGLLARAILPGKQPLGLLWTSLLGMAGSLAGGLVSRAISGTSAQGMHAAGFLGSLVGAIVLLWAYVAYARRKSRTHA